MWQALSARGDALQAFALAEYQAAITAAHEAEVNYKVALAASAAQEVGRAPAGSAAAARQDDDAGEAWEGHEAYEDKFGDVASIIAEERAAAPRAGSPSLDAEEKEAFLTKAAARRECKNRHRLTQLGVFAPPTLAAAAQIAAEAGGSNQGRLPPLDAAEKKAFLTRAAARRKRRQRYAER